MRLPGLDDRQPREKRAKYLEVASDSDQQSSFTPPSSSHSSSSSSDRSHFKVKIPATGLYQDVRKSSADTFPRMAQDLKYPHNESFKAAKVRFQREKLARQQAAQNIDEASELGFASGKTSILTRLASRSKEPTDNMYPSSGPLARRAGPQPVVQLPPQPAFRSLWTEHSRANSASSFLSRPRDRRGTANGTYISSSYNLPNNSQDRPFFHSSAGHFNYSNGSNGLGGNGHEDWRTWVELGIKIFDLPTTTTTRDLWKRFSQEGTVVYIELYENTKGQPDGKACVRFRYGYSLLT